MSENNHQWCVGCSPDNCSGCGGEPVGYVAHGSTMPRNIRVFSGCEILDKERASEYMPECISPLYTTPQPDRTAELEAALKVARAGIEWALSNINCEPFEWSDEENADAHREAIETLAKINEVLND